MASVVFHDITCRRDNNLEKFMVQEKIEGKRLRGRPTRRRLDEIEVLSASKLEENSRNAQDRKLWREIVQATN